MPQLYSSKRIKFNILLCLSLCYLLLITISFHSNAQEKKPAQTAEEKSSTTAVTTVIIDRSKINITAPTAKQTLTKNDLNHYIDEEKIVPLLAGPDDFITLIQQNMTSNNKGVAILLPDWQQTATTPKSLNFLRKTLPEQGWTTITIQPPSKPDNFPSIALKNEERLSQDQKTLGTYLEKLSLMMKTVMDKAKNYPGIFIVIVEGNHAGLLMELYQQEKNAPPNAFIALSSYMLTTETNKQYAQNIANSTFPVLDLFLTRDHPFALQNAPLRLALAKKEIKAYYRQRQLSNRMPSYYPQDDLLININGWLKSIGY